MKQCWNDVMGQCQIRQHWWDRQRRGIQQRRQNQQQGLTIGLGDGQSMTRHNTLLAWMAARIGSGNVHWQIRQQCASTIRQDMGWCSAGILTWTMDSPRHVDTSSGSVAVGRRDNWLDWVAGYGRNSSCEQLWQFSKRPNWPERGSCLERQLCCIIPCNRLYIGCSMQCSGSHGRWRGADVARLIILLAFVFLLP